MAGGATLAAMRRVWAILALVSPVLVGGCYERVVSAKGMGAQGVSVAQPNGPEGARATSTQKKTIKLKEAPSRW